MSEHSPESPNGPEATNGVPASRSRGQRLSTEARQQAIKMLQSLIAAGVSDTDARRQHFLVRPVNDSVRRDLERQVFEALGLQQEAAP